jgi:hypothetical protein
MKFILIVAWFAVPQSQVAQFGAFSNQEFTAFTNRPMLGVAMQEFDNEAACATEAKRLTSPYAEVWCAPKAR